MAIIKVKYRPSVVADKEGRIYYQVIHKRTIRQIRTDYRVYKEEWNEKNNAIIVSGNERSGTLHQIKESIWQDMKRLRTIITGLENHGNSFTADEIIEKYHQSAKEQSFFLFMKSVIRQLKRLNKERTAENYTSTLNSFMRFRNAHDIMLEDINSDLIMEYEAYLAAEGIKMNTISFYMRILRAVCNRAIEKGQMESCTPFKHVYTGIDRTIKRAIPLKAVRQIKELDLSLKPSLDFARDMFMFSFCTRGMSFIDMAYLKKKDLQNGILSYRRRKTGQPLFIKWEQCMQEIVGKYPANETGYLLPIIKIAGNEQRQYRNALRLVNNKLKEVAIRAGIQTNLTMYVARHSWASIAKSRNIPISIISEGMGHDSETTTQIYLASLDSSLIDKANEMILKNL